MVVKMLKKVYIAPLFVILFIRRYKKGTRSRVIPVDDIKCPFLLSCSRTSLEMIPIEVVVNKT